MYPKGGSSFTKTMTGEEAIGRARERWEEIDNEGLDWRSFANGWLEGRINLIKELDNENTTED